jgi:phosphoglycolate phosphatase-like HAD superfamily hydrolase
MATLLVNGRTFPDIQLVVFDKDGTLVDFDHLWGGKAQQWVEGMVQHLGSSNSLKTQLYQAIGYDPNAQRVINDGPLAVASTPVLYTVAAVVLYQHGIHWHQAEQLSQQYGLTSLGAAPTAAEIKPLGDVVGTMRRLVEAGVRIVVATSDGRMVTQATLPHLGITDSVDDLFCGDDPLPNKPNPTGMFHLAEKFNLQPNQILMVGDTVSDMLFGRNAGVAGCVGISSGAGDVLALQETADTVIPAIDAIQVQ